MLGNSMISDRSMSKCMMHAFHELDSPHGVAGRHRGDLTVSCTAKRGLGAGLRQASSVMQGTHARVHSDRPSPPATPPHMCPPYSLAVHTPPPPQVSAPFAGGLPDSVPHVHGDQRPLPPLIARTPPHHAPRPLCTPRRRYFSRSPTCAWRWSTSRGATCTTS